MLVDAEKAPAVNYSELEYRRGLIDGRIEEIEESLVPNTVDRCLQGGAIATAIGGVALSIPTGGISLVVGALGLVVLASDIAKKVYRDRIAEATLDRLEAERLELETEMSAMAPNEASEPISEFDEEIVENAYEEGSDGTYSSTGNGGFSVGGSGADSELE